MSKQDPADQVRFLVSCIGNTTNGRPDFAAVATELGIVSKAAAQKRYERMLKANGVSNKPAAKSISSDDIVPPETPAGRKRKSNGATTPVSKRVKKTKSPKAEEDDDEEEKKDVKPVKATKAAKSAKPATNGKQVKKEESDDSGSPLSDAPESEREVTKEDE